MTADETIDNPYVCVEDAVLAGERKAVPSLDEVLQSLAVVFGAGSCTFTDQAVGDEAEGQWGPSGHVLEAPVLGTSCVLRLAWAPGAAVPEDAEARARLAAYMVGAVVANERMAGQLESQQALASVMREVDEHLVELDDIEQATAEVLEILHRRIGAEVTVSLPATPGRNAVYIKASSQQVSADSPLAETAPAATSLPVSSGQGWQRQVTAYPLGSTGSELGLGLLYEQERLTFEQQRIVQLAFRRIGSQLECSRLFTLVERAKREWEDTFDAINDGVTIVDRDHSIVRCNVAFAAVVGSTPQQLVGQQLAAVLPVTTEVFDDLAKVEAGEDSIPAPVRYELELGGAAFAASVHPMYSDAGEVVSTVHVLRDVTEERRLQATLIRNERLRTLGEMSTGVAHSFGNLLVGIRGWAEVIADSGDEAMKRPANAILQAASDGADSVRKLQDYARYSAGAAKVKVNVNEIVREAMDMASPRWTSGARGGAGIKVLTELGEVPLLMANPAELREVLINLLFNAVDAMPDGGRIKVVSGVKDDAAVISVRDTGTGIEPAVVQRIFEPFYSTKGSAGSGLGLSLVAEIAARHGGKIEVESEPGKGSLFSIRLPLKHAGRQVDG